MTYTEAASELQSGRSKTERPIANNTRLIVRNDGVAIRLHQTDVVILRSDGCRIFNTDDWFTVTTKDRINRYGLADTNYSLASVNKVWVIMGENGDVMGDFRNYCVLTPDGKWHGLHLPSQSAR